MHNPVLAGWCMVVTTMSMAVTTQTLFPFQKHGCFMVVTRLLLAWNNQPIFALEQPCFYMSCNMVGISIWVCAILIQLHAGPMKSWQEKNRLYYTWPIMQNSIIEASLSEPHT